MVWGDRKYHIFADPLPEGISEVWKSFLFPYTDCTVVKVRVARLQRCNVILTRSVVAIQSSLWICMLKRCFWRYSQQWRKQPLRMSGPELIRINEWIKTARRAVSKNLRAVFLFTNTHTNMHTQWRSDTDTHEHTHEHAHAHTHARTHTHTYALDRAHVHTHTCTRRERDTHTHTHTNTHIHTYTCINTGLSINLIL